MMQDYPTTTGGDPGSMTIPLENNDVDTVRLLPSEVQKEMVRNIRQYVKQLGKEYGSTQPTTNSAICL